MKKLNIEIPRFVRKKFSFFLLLIVMVIVGCVVYRFARQNNWLKDNFSTSVEIGKLKTAYSKLDVYMETADRSITGYLETGDKKFMENWDVSMDSLRTIYTRTRNARRQIVYGGDTSKAFFADRLIERKILLLEQLKFLYDNNNRTGAEDLIKHKESIRLSDSFIKYHAIDNNLLQSQIRTNTGDFLTVKSKTNFASYTWMFVSMLLLFVLYFYLRRENRLANKTSGDLRIQKEHLTIILNSLSEGLITTDKLGNIVFMNTSAQQLTQWAGEEAKGKPLHEIYRVVNEETGQTFSNVVTRILEQKKRVELENNTILYNRKNAGLVISNSGTPLMDKRGNISGTVLVFNDITKKKEIEDQLRHSETFNRGVLNSMKSQIAVIDAEGVIVKVNEAWKNFAITNDVQDISTVSEGANYFTVCKKAIPDCHTAVQTIEGIQKVMNGELDEFYLEYPCPTPKEEQWFYMRAMKFESSDMLVVIEHNDITERKKSEEKTRESIERYTIISKATSDTI